MDTTVRSAIDSLLERRERDGRAFTDDELRELAVLRPETAPLVPHYIEGRAQIRPLVEQCVEHIHRNYPMEKFHQLSREKTTRDMPLAIYYAGDSLLLGDINYARDSFLYWFRTILQAFDFPRRTRRQFGAAAAAGKAAPQAVPPKGGGIFGLGRKPVVPAAPTPATAAPAMNASFDDRIGQYVLGEVARLKLQSTVEPFFEGYTCYLWLLKENVSEAAFKAWEPYLVDLREQITANYEPAYATA